jgi:3'-phosphoadenosine 5'-phosphosulfate sulfotransferase (PAPS reductase)/FAD synthetase
VSSDREEGGESSEEWLAREGFDLSALAALPPAPAAAAEFTPDLDSYPLVTVCMSGGKDSVCLLLHLLDLGVPPERIEAVHHLVDGREGSTLMDWPITEAYCEALCKALGVRLTFCWREHGFEGEMTRQESATGAVWIPDGEGFRRVGGNGPAGTRMKFPQVSADLSTRYCSSALKIDVFARYLCNDPKFLNQRTLVLTGERAEESKARAKYKVFEPHRCDTRNSKKVPRHIDTWRAVHSWSEERIWALMRKWRVVPHPAYFLGWSRTSCRACIFGGKNQWASVRAIAPAQFEKIATYEREFRVTIHRHKSVVELADAGTPYTFDPKWVAIANSREWNHPIFVDDWVLPQGAYGDGCGPT